MPATWARTILGERTRVEMDGRDGLRVPPRLARGWARLPWAGLGEEGEARPAEPVVTVRCLAVEDGSVPDEDSAPGNVAVVARAY